jgi:uncharacterized protein
VLGTTAWNFHQEAGLHFLRLYSGGVFKRFPKLKLVFGHMGEMIPFMLERADAFLTPKNLSTLSFIDTYKANVWITTVSCANS